MTKSQRMRESAVMISSTIPSAKYSCSGSPLILANGKTAIDGLSGSGSAPTLPCTLKAVVNRSAFRLAGPGRPVGSSPPNPVARPPGEDLHPGRLAATEVRWEVALRAPVQGLTFVAV